MAYSVIGKVVKGTVGEVKRQVQTVVKNVKNILKQLKELYKTVAKSLDFGKEEQNQSDKSCLDVAESKVGSLLENVKNAIEKNAEAIWNEIENLATNIYNTAIDTVNSTLTTIFGAFKGVLDEISNIFKDLDELFDAVGEELSDFGNILTGDEITQQYGIEEAMKDIFEGDSANIKIGIVKGDIIDAVDEWWNGLSKRVQSQISEQQFNKTISDANDKLDSTYSTPFIANIEAQIQEKVFKDVNDRLKNLETPEEAIFNVKNSTTTTVIDRVINVKSWEDAVTLYSKSTYFTGIEVRDLLSLDSTEALKYLNKKLKEKDKQLEITDQAIDENEKIEQYGDEKFAELISKLYDQRDILIAEIARIKTAISLIEQATSKIDLPMAVKTFSSNITIEHQDINILQKLRDTESS